MTDIADAPPSATRTPVDVDSSTLQKGAVGFGGVFAQGLAAAAPSVALASVPVQLYIVAGKGAVWAAIFGAVLVFFISFTISLQARRTVSSGSLGTYAGNGLGPWAAFATGWSLIIGYVGFAVGGVLGAVLYINGFFDEIGIRNDAVWWKIVILVVVAAVAIYLPYRGISVSAKFELVFEVLALATIFIVIVAQYIHHGFHVDAAQFDLSHLGRSTTFIAAVTAVGSYAGFESAASLGAEARDPHRTISRSLVRIVLILAVVYLLATYPEVIGFSTGPTKLDPDGAALPVVAANAGVPWANVPVDLAVGIAMLVFTSAVVNSASRSIFTLAKEGAIPAALHRVHPKHRTPTLAILFIGALSIVFGVLATVSSAGRLVFDTYLGIVANFGFLTSYLLVVIATPLWLRKIHALDWRAVVGSVLALAGILFVIYNNVFPLPAYPYNVLPWVFVGVLVLGLARYWYLRARRPGVAARIGSIQELSVEEQERLAELELQQAGARA